MASLLPDLGGVLPSRAVSQWLPRFLRRVRPPMRCGLLAGRVCVQMRSVLVSRAAAAAAKLKECKNVSRA